MKGDELWQAYNSSNSIYVVSGVKMVNLVFKAVINNKTDYFSFFDNNTDDKGATINLK